MKRVLLFFSLAIPVSFLIISGIGHPTGTEVPEQNRFTKVILAENLDEPMGMAFLPGSKVLIIERSGGIKLYDPNKKKMKKVATIPVNTTIQRKDGKTAHVEEGLMGVITHPDFNKNHWIYFYYADPVRPRHILARWTMMNEQLIASSKKVILEVPIRREAFKCTGGSMAFDKKGNFYLAVGTNTIDIAQDTIKTAEGNIIINTTETETAGNTNDLRGKILRLKLNDDGSYSIPRDNLFPEGMEKTKPEIYVMGTRNPWRISIDSKTGYLYWADPGRDDNDLDTANIQGTDEFNQAKQPGNFGWPFFVGDNKIYYGIEGSFDKRSTSSTANQPQNLSRFNNGLQHLPPLNTPLISYKYGLSDEFPILGNGGRSAVGGPVFRSADFVNAKRPFPSFFDGKWFITDFIRGWIMTVTLDEEGHLKSVDPFLPGENFSSVLDMNFSPDGDLYVLEYGTKWYSGNSNARLVKIQYEAGNRKPRVNISADKLQGAAPMKVQLSSSGTVDFDQDSLTYEWLITGDKMKKTFSTPNPVVILPSPGKYQAKLTVTDAKGARSFSSLALEAGNEPPGVAFKLANANQTFFFEKDTLHYTVEVADKEDGSLTNGRIKANQVYASIDYTSVSYDQLNMSAMNSQIDPVSGISAGKIILQRQDCKSCHRMTEKSAGPSYSRIAAKYKSTAGAGDLLGDKIIKGGKGVWGDVAMSGHPQLSKNEAKAIADYILSVNKPKETRKIPLSGSYKLDIPSGQQPYGSFILTAAYKDRGSATTSAQTGKFLQLLRYPVLYPRNAEFQHSTRLITTPSKEFHVEGDGSYFGFKGIDLTGISVMNLSVYAEEWQGVAGGYVECYLDSIQGQLVGKSQWVKVVKDRKRIKEGFSLSGKQIKGSHDIYFVFKNPQAMSNQALMEVSSVEFKR